MAKKKGWQPILTLPDEPTPAMVLWNPCDGVHPASILYTSSDMAMLRTGKVYTHWQELERPKA